MRAMAHDESSPHEAAIARKRLTSMGESIEPPRPRERAPGPFVDDEPDARWTATNPVDWTVTVETDKVGGRSGFRTYVVREGPFVDE